MHQSIRIKDKENKQMKKTLLSLALFSALVYGGDYTNSIGMKFKDIPSGSYTMGTSTPSCPKDDPFTDRNEQQECVKSVRDSETPAHRVSVDGFYLGETEVTQGQWYEVMGNNPSYFRTGDRNMPVEQVRWDDIQSFISRLNSKEGTDKYRLPTEEEWEYAARAGTTTKWYCGDNESCVSSIAVYDTDRPNKVKSKKPNKWGLYDMSGNVWEWVQNCYRSNYNETENCSKGIMRGGAYDYRAGDTRSAFRFGIGRGGMRGQDIGFRLLMTK
jgi:formylglycine-generating enzyme required for sulfatase activity